MDESKSSKVFNYLYSHAIPDRGLYGASQRRDGRFVEFIRKTVKKGSSVLDAGCGRGFLIRWLRDDGYEVLGTEIADCLFRPGGELYGMPAVKMYYSELGSIADNFYNVTVSNDVLEHLEDEDAVIRAMEDLARIASDYVLISTGGCRASRCPFPEILGVYNLHTVTKPKGWWVSLYEQFCVTEDFFEAAGSIFLFGRPR